MFRAAIVFALSLNSGAAYASGLELDLAAKSIPSQPKPGVENNSSFRDLSLGMTRDAVNAILQTQGFKADEFLARKSEGPVKIKPFVSHVRASKNDGSSTDSLVLQFTSPASGERLYRMTMNTRYNGSEFSRDDLQKSVEEKWGKPTDVYDLGDRFELTWAFDLDGKVAQSAKCDKADDVMRVYDVSNYTKLGHAAAFLQKAGCGGVIRFGMYSEHKRYIAHSVLMYDNSVAAEAIGWDMRVLSEAAEAAKKATSSTVIPKL